MVIADLTKLQAVKNMKNKPPSMSQNMSLNKLNTMAPPTTGTGAATPAVIKPNAVPTQVQPQSFNKTQLSVPVANYKGGIDYNNTNAAGRAAVTANEQRLKDDPAFAGQDLQRALQVQSDMAAQGLDTSQQDAYIKRLQGMVNAQGAQGVTEGSDNSSNNYIRQMRDLAVKQANQAAYDSRNQTDAVNLQNAQGLQELMANRGLGASGENITATLQQNAARSNDLNSINNQLAANIANIDMNMAQQLQNQSNIDKDRALQIANMMGNYNGQSTLAGRQFDWGKATDMANLTGYLNGQRTMAGQSFDWGKTMDSANMTGYFNGNPTFAREQFNRNNFVDDRNYNRGVYEDDRNYDRGVYEDDRNYDRGVYVDDRNYDRGVFESDRGYNRNVFESDRAYDRGVLESDRDYGLASRKASGGGSGGSKSTKGSSDTAIIADLNKPKTSSTMETWLLKNLPGGTKTAGPIVDSKEGAGGKITASQLEWIETNILANPNLSDKDIIKLFKRFGISLPE
ncbi:hypothetical protein [Paenibacillus sp. NEAU-GSW1]|uniref:hypothetical protein n=1 Tax=Paenibacillus sp. NEAU-GSW1 TaxID=2682486 RepID=UPI0012E324A1|nr:hypothetical protein [Paenibacillus sp. NEAU-GSW1]MUT66005.1 hypothetical protein [Paenibacillus sp. NEAU-GSW1]